MSEKRSDRYAEAICVFRERDSLALSEFAELPTRRDRADLLVIGPGRVITRGGRGKYHRGRYRKTVWKSRRAIIRFVALGRRRTAG